MVRLVFTRADIECLMRLSARHYDHACLCSGQCGGIVFGMRIELDLLDSDEVERALKFREIDLLAKVTEPVCSKDPLVHSLRFVLLQAMSQINALANTPSDYVDIVFEALPGPEGTRLIEVE